jgi:preprotein translocase subunit SecD
VIFIALLLLALLWPYRAAASQSSIPPAATPSASPISENQLCQDQIELPEITVTLTTVEAVDSTAIDEIAQVIGSRINSILNGQCFVAVSESGRITVILSATSYPKFGDSSEPTPLEIASLLGNVGFVEFIDPQGRKLDAGTVVATTISTPISGTRIGGAPVFETLASSANVVKAFRTRSSLGSLNLEITFDGETGDRLLTYTRRHAGDSIVIAIDQQVFNSIFIATPIAQDVSVEGLSAEEFRMLFAYLNSGPLPLPLTVNEVTRSSDQGLDIAD